MHSEAISPEPSSGADPSLFRLFGRISDHHTHIETDKNKIKVKTQSQTPVNRNAFQKIPGIDLTLVIRCQPIVFQIPDVTGISEHGAIELPEEAETVLEICFKFYVTSLVRNNKDGVAGSRTLKLFAPPL